MRLRWLGVSGVALLLTGLVLMVAGPRLWPAAFFGPRTGAMPGEMMGGMMDGGMMGSLMSPPEVMGAVMSGEVAGDPALPFDLRFLDQMVSHHQMAVHSAQMMIANSERPALREIAQRIITAQQREIDQMLAWRAAWFPGAGPAPAMTMMGGGSGMMGGDMMGGPGGMPHAQEQMGRLFLEMMIPHHEAAISMAEQTLAESDRPEIRVLAEAIISSQTAEIAKMRGYLRDFFGVTAP